MRRPIAALLIALAATMAGCVASDEAVLTFSGSALGSEGETIRGQLQRFAEERGVRVELRVTPDTADERHQLYVQWLNARVDEPDVLQLDVIWTAEFAAAGWILPAPAGQFDTADFFPGALDASRWRGTLYSVPWFVDVGLLYRRTDLVADAPGSLAELRAAAQNAVQAGDARFGIVWQGARYEGLVTVFLEHLGAFGGAILDDRGEVAVDSPEAIEALTFMRDAVGTDGFAPSSVLTWREEQVRFAFQNGEAAFMRNWPYAFPLLQDASQSAVDGLVAVSAFPAADGGRPTTALGGGQLAVNAHSADPQLAWALVEFLTAPAQMLERARATGHLPARRSVYGTQELADALTLPADAVRAALEAAVARPVTPVYSELSELLQVRVHRALTGQQEPAAALQDAAREMRALLVRTGLAPDSASPPSRMQRPAAR